MKSHCRTSFGKPVCGFCLGESNSYRACRAIIDPDRTVEEHQKLKTIADLNAWTLNLGLAVLFQSVRHRHTWYRQKAVGLDLCSFNVEIEDLKIVLSLVVETCNDDIECV